MADIPYMKQHQPSPDLMLWKMNMVAYPVQVTWFLVTAGGPGGIRGVLLLGSDWAGSWASVFLCCGFFTCAFIHAHIQWTFIKHLLCAWFWVTLVSRSNGGHT